MTVISQKGITDGKVALARHLFTTAKFVVHGNDSSYQT